MDEEKAGEGSDEEAPLSRKKRRKRKDDDDFDDDFDDRLEDDDYDLLEENLGVKLKRVSNYVELLLLILCLSA